MSLRGMNKVLLIGNLSNDPTIKQTPNGNPYAHFVVMVNRKLRGRDQIETSRIVCECWQQSIYTHLAQGRRVYVEGALKTWEEKQADGSMRTRQIVNVDDVLYLDKPHGIQEETEGSALAEELQHAQAYNQHLQERIQQLQTQLDEAKAQLVPKRPIETVRHVEVALKAAKKAGKR